MPDTSNGNNLEAARTRLETALSGLTQSVASTRGALDVAVTIADEKAQMAERITALEQENLKLHEQVAALALQSASSDADEKIASLEQEKAAIDQNYQMLKERYAELQGDLASSDENENQANSTLQAENIKLRETLASMEQEKTKLKSELDKTIAELEALLETA